MLVWVFDTLMRSPGSFVPNIQRFVSGLESSAKRLAVSIYEDSSLPSDRFGELFSLLGGALLAQRVSTWKPSKDLVDKWKETMIYAYETLTSYVVDYRKESTTAPFCLDQNNNVLENSSALLDELRSFPTDLGLARGWAKEIVVKEAKSRPEVMPYYHCVDHHWMPSIVYFFNYEIAKQTEQKQKQKVLSRPFEPLFNAIFFFVTGVNPRQNGRAGYKEDFEQREFVRACRKAQRLCMISLQSDQQDRPTIGEYIFEHTIPDDWLAGLVGVIKVRVGKTNTIVTLKTDDPTQFVATRAPLARRGKTSYVHLTDDEEAIAISTAKQRLQKGLLLDQAISPDSSFKNARAILKDDEYIIQFSNGQRRRWEECKNITVDVPIHPDINRDLQACLTKVGDGVEENFLNKIIQLAKQHDENTVNRLLIYLNVDTTIVMSKVNREGGSNSMMSVSMDDIMVYHILLKISSIAPAAIKPMQYSPGEFVVSNVFLLSYIKKHIQEVFRYNEDSKGWTSRFADISRTPYEYQTLALQDMINNHNRGMKGNFLWLQLGSGKTYLVLNYLRWLKDNNELPKYVLYTLPPESVISIIQEINYFDIPIHVIIPLKNISKKRQQFAGKKVSISKDCDLRPYHINIIYHDHLKNCRDVLPIYAKNSVIVFDEVHLFLNQTLRTGVGMDLAMLCKEFISLTGTPIVDNKTEKLIGWLKQIVPFEVNKKNFWVAANNMIAKETTTGLKTKTEHRLISMNKKQTNEYRKLVPPALGGTNTNPRSYDWMSAAQVCYEACDEYMVELTKHYVKQGRGVMLVVRDSKHQEKMYNSVVKYIQPVFQIKKDQTIFLTDETVENKQTPDYKVVIVPKNRSQGYTLTRLNVMITSVYPSNSATREQLRGRINRIGQRVEPVLYEVVHTGILTSILENHQNASNLLQALQTIAKQL